MQEADHPHKICIHLELRILNGAEFQRAAYSHSGVADENVYPAFRGHDAVNCGLALLLVPHVRLEINYPRYPVTLLAERAIHLVAVGVQPFCHRPAESGSYARYQNSHSAQIY